MLTITVQIDLHIPTARSLKSKRGVIKPLRARLTNDLGVSVCELDHNDSLQRSLIGVAIACKDEQTGRRVAQDVEAICERVSEAEVLAVVIDVFQTEDRGFELRGVEGSEW